jgi:hypothetical protein
VRSGEGGHAEGKDADRATGSGNASIARSNVRDGEPNCGSDPRSRPADLPGSTLNAKLARPDRGGQP